HTDEDRDRNTHTHTHTHTTCLLSKRILTRAPQWAAISSKGAFWNFSTTCLLRSFSCSSIPTLSTTHTHTHTLQLLFSCSLTHAWTKGSHILSPLTLTHIAHSF